MGTAILNFEKTIGFRSSLIELQGWRQDSIINSLRYLKRARRSSIIWKITYVEFGSVFPVNAILIISFIVLPSIQSGILVATFQFYYRNLDVFISERGLPTPLVFIFELT